LRSHASNQALQPTATVSLPRITPMNTCSSARRG
jgi:hypothetical protein